MDSTNKKIRDLAYEHSFEVELLLIPEAWKAAPPRHLSWASAPFPPKPRSAIPKTPGVYAFVANPRLDQYPPSTAMFYVGKATDLYSRIGSYIYQIGLDFDKTRRPQVWRMINQWRGHLSYYYVTTPSVAQAEEIESEIQNALRPPFNKEYPAETSKSMRAF